MNLGALTIDPDVPADALEAFVRYEQALLAPDLDALCEAFWPEATRYGTDGNQLGQHEIDAARRRSRSRLDRTIEAGRVLLVAPGVVVTEVEFRRTDGGAPGRQSQVWVERSGRWGIVHAHVSMLPDPPDPPAPIA